MLITKKIGNRKTVGLLISLVFLFLQAISVFAQEDDGKTVTVAYFYANNFQEGCSNDVMKSGYSYEYLQKISDYTGWRYKYVYGDWEQLYLKFIAGEIDLFPGLVKNKENESTVLFPKSYMDSYNQFIFVKKDSSFERFNPSSINEKKIGAIKNKFIADNLFNWAKENNVSVSLEFYDNEDELLPALLLGEIDGIVGTEAFYDVSDKIKPFYHIASEEAYLCVRNNAYKTLDELNFALESILENDPSFINSLSSKYYKNVFFSKELSDVEIEWLKNHKELNLGFIEDYSPYSMFDKDGNVSGIITDIVEQWLSRLQIIDKLNVNYIAYKNYPLMLSGLVNKEIDAAFPVPSNRWYSEQSDMMETANIIHSQMTVFFLGEFNEQTFESVAITSRPLQPIYLQQYFPQSRAVYVSSAQECLDAVIDKKASCTILSGYRANTYSNYYRKKNMNMMVLDNGVSYSIGLRKGEVGLLSLFNRGISLLDSSYLSDKMFNYYEYTSDYKMKDFITDHILLFVSILLGIIILITIAFLLYVKGISKAHREIQAQVDVSQALSYDYLYAVVIDVQTDTYITVKSQGEILLYKDRTAEKANGTLWNNFFENCVVDHDKDQLRNEFKFNNIIEGLKSNQEFSCAFTANFDGNLHTMQVTFSKIYSHNLRKYGILAGFRLIDNIVAEEKKQKDLLQNALDIAENSNRAKTAFLNSMSHDIRTPMNAIIGFTNLALSHINNKKTVKGYLDKILLSSNHLLGLINDVLEMSRIESGKIKINEEEIQLTKMLDELKSMVQANMLQKKLVFEIDTSEVINNSVIADKLKLNQILLNIVGNSIKFTNPGGEIKISVYENRQTFNDYAKYEFHIKDNGIGMSKEFQEHIFEAFSREQTSTVSKIPGTGLGMAITKNIVEMMGGTISVNSEEGVGTEFIIYLQFKISGKKVKAVRNKKLKELYSDAKKNFSRKSILLVEDNELNQEIAVTILEEIGFDVDIAEDGTVAVSKIMENKVDHYDLILMDIQMPKMDGYQATRIIRSIEDERGQIPIIAMTANAFDEDKQNSIAAGMNAHITKPLDIPVLLNTINDVFE